MKRLLFLLVIVGLFAAFTIPPKKFTLQYVFEEGDSFRLISKAEQLISQDIPQMGKVDVTNTTDGSFLFTVKSVSNGIAECEVKYEYMKVVTENPMVGTVTMDSKSEESNPMNDMMKGFTEGSFTLKLHPNGTVSDIEGIEEVFENAISALSGMNPQQATAIKSQVSGQFGPEALTANIEGALVFYSDEKVDKGSSWTSSLDIAGGIYGTTTSNWTINEVNGDEVQIGVAGAFKSDFEREMDVNGLKGAKFKITGTQIGTYSVSKANGWIKGSEVEVKMSGNLDIPAGGMIPQDMSIPMEINSQTQYIMERL
jgi:hypothetical protein